MILTNEVESKGRFERNIKNQFPGFNFSILAFMFSKVSKGPLLENRLTTQAGSDPPGSNSNI
jgi:hypothetical protein